MIYFLLLIRVFVPLVLIYYMFVTLQLVGVVKITKRKIKFWTALIPFYYFIK